MLCPGFLQEAEGKELSNFAEASLVATGLSCWSLRESAGETLTVLNNTSARLQRVYAKRIHGFKKRVSKAYF